MYHVKEVTTAVPGNLDMNIAEEDEFSPDKLRSTVERLYMTVVCTSWPCIISNSLWIRSLVSWGLASTLYAFDHGANNNGRRCFVQWVVLGVLTQTELNKYRHISWPGFLTSWYL